MSWTNWPPSAGTNINDWDFLIQPWIELRKRWWAIDTANPADSRWPQGNTVFDSGTISALTATTLTDATKNWGSGGANWPFDPIHTDVSAWDVILDCRSTDPKKPLRAQVLSWAATQLTISDLTDYVTEGVISSISSLAGTRYALIKRDGLWWSDRWMHWPDERFDHGTVSSSTAQSLTEEDRTWPPGKYASGSGYELLVRGSDGYLRRLTLVGNTRDTLLFADQLLWTPSVGQPWCIVPTGGMAIPGRDRDVAFAWYRGAMDFRLSHYPDDQIHATKVPAPVVYFSENSPPHGCQPKAHEAFDLDVWSQDTGGCSENDKCYSPHIFRTLRMCQATAEAFCTQFIEPREYEGFGGYIRQWSVAECFVFNGINPVSIPYTNSTPVAQSVWWTVITANNTVRSSGVSSVAPGATITLADLDAGYQLDDTTAASLGWTRKTLREFRLMYDRTAFVADLDLGVPVDPPTDDENGAGNWFTRAKSTCYKEHDQYGYVIDGSEDFIVGAVALYSGDNWNDGNIGADSFTNYSELIPYRDRQNELIGANGKSFGEVGSRSGVATVGGNTWLEDTNQNWWEGVLYTHSGTFTTGSSSTRLVDSSKSTSYMWNHGNDRHRFADFILEITNGPNAGTRAPILAYDQSTRIATFADLGFDPTSYTYRIREPRYLLNYWKGATLRVKKPDGSITDIAITHNDDTRLYFADPGFAITPGMSYSIIRHVPGGCWRWNGSSWEKPTGNDPRTGTPWPDDQAKIAPYSVTRYGRLMKSDVMHFVAPFWTELKTFIESMEWMLGNLSWTNQGDTNHQYGGANNGEFWKGNTTDATAEAAKAYTGQKIGFPHQSAEDNSPPYASAYGANTNIAMLPGVNIVWWAVLGRQYAYPKVSGLHQLGPTGAWPQVDCYAWADFALNPGSPYVVEAQAFHNYGDGFLFREWHKMQSIAAAAATEIGTQVGGLGIPTPVSYVGPDSTDNDIHTATRGYSIQRSCSIIKWEFGS